MKKIIISDTMQKGSYYLSEAMGANFDPDFKPELSPKELLALGLFGGKYMTDCRSEFPEDWFDHAKLSPTRKDISLNYYQVDASQPLKVWQANGWINPIDPRGWFQWYCRYYYGRRVPDEDRRQIKRWKAMVRLKRIAKKWIKAVAKNSVRPCCTGPMIVANFNLSTDGQLPKR
ncbi:hypothetical protein [Acetobacterium sp. MES1]|uniref:hypothetical protein n=1 Tax=Acetobacterium sp. MES1 TaxID=1899015 RepID=UPI00257AA173|nr:hypothetical protein [Acetobacterium sp. MES1]